LACGIPNLRLDPLAIRHGQDACGELHTDRTLLLGTEVVAREAGQQVALANTYK
jgi:hypothetical protein